MKMYVCSLFLALISIAPQAHAERSIASTGGYESLRDVNLGEAQQPRFRYGVDHLGHRETRFKEHLPMQLSQPIKKISSRHYR